MEALLNAASARSLNSDLEDVQPFLTISSTAHRRDLISPSPKTLGTASLSRCDTAEAVPPLKIFTLDDALQELKSQPSLTELSSILSFLSNRQIEGTAVTTLEIYQANAKTAQIVKALVDIIIPDFWEIFKAQGRDEDRESLLKCLRSTTGLGGMVARLNLLVKTLEKVEKEETKRHIVDLLEALEGVIGKKSFIFGVWSDILHMETIEVKRVLLWKEFIALVAGSKVLNATMMAENVLLGEAAKEEEKARTLRWVGDGRRFCEWLGKGIRYAAGRLMVVKEDEEGWKIIRLLWWKSSGLAWWNEIVENVTFSLLKSTQNWEALKQLLVPSHSREKQKYLGSLLTQLVRKYLSPTISIDPNWWAEEKSNVSGIAAIVKGIFGLGPEFEHTLLEWTLSSPTPIGLQRAIIAAFQDNQKNLNFLFEKNLQMFGDKLSIKHTPVRAQEANTQLLLLIAGELYRRYPSTLKNIMYSSLYLNTVSNRLATQSERPRFLGMVLAECLSNLVDLQGSKLNFKLEELQSDEALWWKGLVNIEDEVGDISNLFLAGVERKKQEKKGKTDKMPLPPPRKPLVSTSKIVNIVDLEEEEEEEKEGERIEAPTVKPVEEESEEEDSEDEFTPYAKPDEDPEDSDDDPTLINRKKEAPPVYIRDLLRLLRAQDDYDKQLLALQHAPLLIRRKATFGTEVSDHLYELASNFAGMHDRFDMPLFQEMRVQALIAIVVTFPVKMGQWCAQAFYEGDYSLNQRAVVLTAIGIGARELAGYKDENLPLSEMSGKGKAPEDLFPSKVLPGKMHEIYSQSQSPLSHVEAKKQQKQSSMKRLDFLAQNLERSIIQPMASEAVEKSTPSLLKAIQVRTFSKRMEIEKARPKPTASKLGKVVAEAFFFPLVGRWWVKVREISSSTSPFTAATSRGRERGTVSQLGQLPQSQPFLLTQFLKTLTLILHASGPSTTGLPQMTREFWDLLFSLRNYSTNYEPTVLEAVLLGLLTLLELNIESGESGKIRLVDEFAKELVETHEWVGQVFDNAPTGGMIKGLTGVAATVGDGGGGRDEEGRIRYLSAAVLIKTKEIMEGYERRLIGSLMSLD